MGSPPPKRPPQAMPSLASTSNREQFIHGEAVCRHTFRHGNGRQGPNRVAYCGAAKPVPRGRSHCTKRTLLVQWRFSGAPPPLSYTHTSAKRRSEKPNARDPKGDMSVYNARSNHISNARATIQATLLSHSQAAVQRRCMQEL